jgi:hypothetical protein
MTQLMQIRHKARTDISVGETYTSVFPTKLRGKKIHVALFDLSLERYSAMALKVIQSTSRPYQGNAVVNHVPKV